MLCFGTGFWEVERDKIRDEMRIKRIKRIKRRNEKWEKWEKWGCPGEEREFTTMSV